ncbi:MAG TPA: hypothetical protein VMV10_15345 [Pirellulales bacterium]|nr:hypothetical protein [Pirellulales bacterium]
MKTNKWRTWGWASLAAVALGGVALVACVQRVPAVRGERPSKGASRESKSNPFAAFERNDRGPVHRNEPVGWVFGRLVGVNASTMTTFESASVPPVAASRPGAVPRKHGGPRR